MSLIPLLWLTQSMNYAGAYIIKLTLADPTY